MLQFCIPTYIPIKNKKALSSFNTDIVKSCLAA